MRAFWGFACRAVALGVGGSFIFITSTYGETSARVEIDLSRQRAYLIEGQRVVLTSPVSSGRSGHLTRPGSFKVIEKEHNHRSSIYGKIVDASGRTIVADADIDMKVPPGGRFVSAPMPYFMRFDGANGLHAGYLPGYPASHGCVRMPDQMAIAFYNAVEVGTPVTVFGRTPQTNEYYRYGPQPTYRQRERIWQGRDPRYDPRLDPRNDPRYAAPWWR